MDGDDGEGGLIADSKRDSVGLRRRWEIGKETEFKHWLIHSLREIVVVLLIQSIYKKVKDFMKSRFKFTAEVFELNLCLYVVELRKSCGEASVYRQIKSHRSN
ncbi:hypothetical protein L2E82_26560 [Cichorium intybus]|uniref:Uncharacterized protein n=1 Tax=Cichorium intybus TaxID=13427 RepID=A0ACB9CQP3_CICIN|nr:hypothetical protein L2E82_26560 [Cichorium intybus]